MVIRILALVLLVAVASACGGSDVAVSPSDGTRGTDGMITLKVEGQGSATVDAGGVARWRSAWCTLKVGQSKVGVVEAMGEPTMDYPDAAVADSDAQSNWADGDLSLTAFYQGGVVAQLDAQVGVDPAEDLGCPAKRGSVTS